MKKLLVAACLLAPLAASAADLGDEAAVVRRALSTNADLRVARLTIAEAEARLRGAGRLSNPEIEAVVAGGRDFEGRIELGLYQRFPLSARLRLEKEVSRLELEAARCEVDIKEREIATRTRRAFLEYARADQMRLLREQAATLGGTFADSLGRRVAEGFASPLDATQATLEVKKLRASIEELKAEEIGAASQLATLLALPPGETIQITRALPLPKSMARPAGISTRADIRLAEIGIEAAEKDLGLARALRREDIGVGVFVEGERFRDEPEGIENEALLGLKLTLPLPVWQNGEAAVAEKKLLSQRRRELLAILRRVAADQAESAWKQMSARLTAARQMQEDVLPLARKLLTDTQSAYERGEADVQRLFRAREYLLEIETAAFESRIQFHLARAEWLASTGEPLKP